MPDLRKKRPSRSIRYPPSGRGAVSAVKMSERLTAEIDAWAEDHGMARADAICRLVELGLSGEPAPAAAPASRIELEEMAIRQIGELLDPSLPLKERERRIRRLIDGPPEFISERIDLPRSRK